MNMFQIRQALRGQRSHLPYWATVLIVLLFVAIYIPLARQVISINKQLPTTVSAAPVKAAQATSTITASTAAPVNVQPKQVSVTTSPPAPACTPSSFSPPSALNLTGKSGVTIQNDSPSYYQIYGYTATQLRSQIKHCAPYSTGTADAEFTGQTAYNINWSYDYTNLVGLCTISNVRVGVHTAIALPYWVAPNSATSGLNQRWQSFANGLATHEQGHVALNNQYASLIADDIQTIGTLSCGDVSTTVNNIANRDLATLNGANDAYDAATNHGATQGAILPNN